MSLESLFRIISLGILLMLLVIKGCLRFYEKKINQAAERGRPTKSPMILPPKVAKVMNTLVYIAILLPLIPDAVSSINRVRDLERSVEQKAAEKQMSVAFVSSDDAAAALYYEEDGSDHTFALYENRGTFFKEYVFIHGGSATSIDQGVRAFRMETSGELVLFSMNKLRIAEIVCHNGDAFHLDPDSPFAIILPDGGADLYDEDGEFIDLKQNEWYVVTTKDKEYKNPAL